MKILDTYLKENGTTRAKVARTAGINPTALQRATEREATDINSRVIVAIAETIKKTPGQVFDGLIETEMNTDMTSDETKLLLMSLLDNALVTIEDMGDGAEAIVAEIDLPSSETIRFSVNKLDKPITKESVLTALSYAMDDYTHEDGGKIYPSQPTERPLIDAEYMGIDQGDADYLAYLSKQIFRARK